MILSINGNKWVKAGIVVAVLVLALVAWAWMVGAFFLGLTGSDAAATPLTAYQYYYYYQNDTETIKWLVIAAIAATVVILLPLGVAFTPKRRSLHGDARFARHSDIKNAGLNSETGIIVGKRGSSYLVFGGDQHVLLAAPTGSGKTVSIGVPNLLNWPDSVVVLDTKQENWDITSGYRERHGQTCYLFNPACRDYRTHKWNPLHYISDDPNFRVNDIQKIAHMLYPDIDNVDPIWSSSCRSLFLALTLFLLETEGKATLGEVYRQSTSGADKRLPEIIKSKKEEGNPLSAEFTGAFNDYLDTSTNTRSSIRKTFTSRLELLSNPVIDAATSGNDFDLSELRKKKISIYVGITPDDLGRLGPLINLFFQQVIDLNTRELFNKKTDHQCLMLMDEFAAIGKIPILSKGISYIRGYGLRMLPIIQDPAQLREIYGAEQAKTFTTNHAVRIIFAPKDIETAEEISKTLGTQTVKNRSKTKQLTGSGGRSLNTSDHARALLLPQEVMQIGEQAEIIITENTHPIQAKKVIYYKDKNFLSRCLPAAEAPLLVIEKREAQELIEAGEATKERTSRPATAEDIKQLEEGELNLEDFGFDYSAIEVPEGPISDEQMDNLVSQFFDQLEAAPAI